MATGREGLGKNLGAIDLGKPPSVAKFVPRRTRFRGHKPSSVKIIELTEFSKFLQVAISQCSDGSVLALGYSQSGQCIPSSSSKGHLLKLKVCICQNNDILLPIAVLVINVFTTFCKMIPLRARTKPKVPGDVREH